jgi:uncharacterized protein (TIGR00296 family)
MKINLSQAKKLIALARQSIIDYFDNDKTEASAAVKKEFSKKSGVFVSLYVKEELMGCIGYAEPLVPLYQAVIEVSRAAAFEDPRFPPIKKSQMKDLRIEISVLTDPKEIEVNAPEEYPSKVKIGKDGLVIKDEFGWGLLLPQVAVEWGWNAKEFLNQTCVKAGLSPDCWDNMKRNVYKFQAQIYTEENGKIVEKKLKK